MGRTIRATFLVLLVVPAIAGCTQSWQDDYRKGAQALKEDRFDDAERFLNEGIKKAQAENNLAAEAVCYLGLARTHIDQGEYGQARPLFEQAIKFYEQANDQPHLAETLVELSACFYEQQMLAQAEPLCRRAIEIETKLAKPNVQTVGTAYNNLAQICKARDEQEKAEEYYNKAIETYGHDVANSDASVRGLVDTYCNLAMLYKRQERFPMARVAADKALKAQDQAKKKNDLARVAVLNTVASIERAQFDNESAEKHYQEAVSILKKHDLDGSAYDEVMCDTLDNYADLQMDWRELDQAERNYNLSIARGTESRGANHPSVAERMVDLANLYRRTERYQEAEDLLKHALDIYSASYDSQSPIVINTINDLSAVYLDEKKYELANQLYEEWLPKLEQRVGRKHAQVADALDNWALVADRSDDTAQAKDLRARAKTIRLALTTK